MAAGTGLFSARERLGGRSRSRCAAAAARAYPDLDLVVPRRAIKLCQRLAKKHRGTAVVLDSEQDMARLVLGPWSWIWQPKRGGSDSDLQRRDYSINALALPLSPGAGCSIPPVGWAISPSASCGP